MQLKNSSLLKRGEYRIEKVLGQGGFGITYLAEQTSLQRKVAIKEFFMKGHCNRDSGTSHVSVPPVGSRELVERFRQKFIKEARTIASFSNAHIISIHDVFEENGTAYYVMEYLEGNSLVSMVKEQGVMPETLAVKYISQVAEALAEVHANKLLHLDVKPANIMLNKKGEAVLIDFGISKHYDESGVQTSSASVGVSEGYAPLEQYEAGALDSFTPATDIYALGATLFFLLTGKRPPKASEVMNYGLPEFPSNVSPSVRNVIATAMHHVVRMRFQSVDTFVAMLDAAGKVLPVTVADGSCKGTPEFTYLQATATSGGACGTQESDVSHVAEKAKKTSSNRGNGVSTFLIVFLLLLTAGGVGVWFAVWGDGESVNSLSEIHDSHSILTFNVDGVEFTMIAVESGTFRMGSESGDEDEMPTHYVTLDDYYIGETEITQGLWRAVMGTDIYAQAERGTEHTELRGVGNDYPMYYISYEDCKVFLENLNYKLEQTGQLTDGRRFRMPTEAEWEFAARGGNEGKRNNYKYSGSNIVGNVAWCCESWNNGIVHRVKGKRPNELGIYDMSGNVWEWCYDSYGDYSGMSQDNPKVDKGYYSNRVLRGGSWIMTDFGCRVANRNDNAPDYRGRIFGLRLAL